MYVCLDENVHSANAVQRELFVLVLTPVSQPGHVSTTSVELLVSWKEVSVMGTNGRQLLMHIPSAKTVSFGKLAASLRPLGDSTHEL